MAELGYFRFKQLTEDVAKKIAASHGWEIKERPPQESPEKRKKTPPSEGDDYIGTIIVDTPYKDEARYNTVYDIAERIINDVLTALNEDSQDEEE